MFARFLSRPITCLSLAVGLVFLVVGCSPEDFLSPASDQPLPPEEPPTGSAPLLAVEQIEVQVLQSDPVQVQVVVRGTLPDACTEIGEIRQSRDGETVSVTIETHRPADALCAQVLVPIESVVPLEGSFPPGTYAVTVNGVSASFTV